MTDEENDNTTTLFLVWTLLLNFCETKIICVLITDWEWEEKEKHMKF